MIYISGPMTGIRDFNYPAFNGAEKLLREHGHGVINPAALAAATEEKCERLYNRKATWADYMRENIIGLMHCDTIVLLDGWENSKGAVLEVIIAWCLGLRFFEPDGRPTVINPGALATNFLNRITSYR